MEKKQKIAMKKLQFVIVISLGSNCPGVIIRGQCNSPWWELSEGQLSQVEIVWGEIVLGGGQFSGRGNFPSTTFPTETYCGNILLLVEMMIVVVMG